MTGVLSRLQWEKRDRRELCWTCMGNTPIAHKKHPDFENNTPEYILATISPHFPKKEYPWRVAIYEPTGRSRGAGRSQAGVLISRRWNKFMGPVDPNMKLYSFDEALELWLMHVRMIRSQA